MLARIWQNIYSSHQDTREVKWIKNGSFDDPNYNAVHYRSFTLNGEEIKVGQHVLVDNSKHPDDNKRAFVAKITDLLDTLAADENMLAVVDWYWRVEELPKRVQRKVEFGSDEVLLNTGPIDNEVDLETIIGRCQVKEVASETEKPSSKLGFDGKFVTDLKGNKISHEQENKENKPRSSSKKVQTPKTSSSSSKALRQSGNTPQLSITAKESPKSRRKLLASKPPLLDDNSMDGFESFEGEEFDTLKKRRSSLPGLAPTPGKKLKRRQSLSAVAALKEEHGVVTTRRVRKEPKKKLEKETEPKPDMMEKVVAKIYDFDSSDSEEDFEVCLNLASKDTITTPKSSSKSAIHSGRNRTPKSYTDPRNKSQITASASSKMRSKRKVSDRTPEVIENDFESKRTKRDEATPTEPPSTPRSSRQETTNSDVSTPRLRRTPRSAKKPVGSSETPSSKDQSTVSENGVVKVVISKDDSGNFTRLKSPSKRLEVEDDLEATPKRSSTRSRRTPANTSQENTPVSTPKRAKSEDAIPKQLATPKSKTGVKEKNTPKSSARNTPKRVRRAESMATPTRLSTPRTKKKVVDYDEDFDAIAYSSESNFSDFDDDLEEDDDEFVEEHYCLPVNKNQVKISRSKTPKVTRTIKRKAKGDGHSPFLSMRSKKVAPAKSALEQARTKLHVSVLPDNLPCRETEFSDILHFVSSKIADDSGGCMYISGVPGTGKTATVYQVVKDLKESMRMGDLPRFKYIEINGMRLTEPNQVFVQILKQLSGKKATADHAAALLDKQFDKPDPRRETVLLLVDELDMMCTRKQTVMYNLFDWPTRRHARLIVLAISNTMDLPERVMMNRVSSRLGLTRIHFQPYTHSQLQEIVLSRIAGVKAFDEDAVQLVARKVASLSGDARRALDICRRATELAELKPEEGKKTNLVSMTHINMAVEEMFSSPKILFMRSRSKHEQIFLRAIVAEFQRTGVEETTLCNISKQYRTLCGIENLSPLNSTLVSALSTDLSVSRLLLVEDSNLGTHRRVRLNVSQDDVLFAMRNAI